MQFTTWKCTSVQIDVKVNVMVGIFHLRVEGQQTAKSTSKKNLDLFLSLLSFMNSRRNNTGCKQTVDL